MTHASRLTKRLAVGLALALSALGAVATDAMARSPRAVYTLTNSPSGNEVKVFKRSGDGSLAERGEFATGGTGTGGGLGNQGALVRDGKRLFAVNPGSDSISSLRVRRRGLELIDTDLSGGTQPISLTVHDGLLYVLHAGGAGNITGHTVSRHGALSPLLGSTRGLSGPGAGPAQVSFDPTGRTLVVTEKDTNRIDTYEVRGDGLSIGPRIQPSAGQTPFGFAFDKRGHLIVSEAFGGAPDASAVSSYAVTDGVIDPITASAATTETAACWIVVTRNGRFTYTSNTGSDSISGYAVSRDGELRLLDPDGRTAVTGAGPIDMALSRKSRFLYSLNSGDGTIDGFRVRENGSLKPIGGAAGLPEGANGLAAR
jgi:6-phosphogluconolactonase (cycloisomerase 2 family)